MTNWKNIEEGATIKHDISKSPKTGDWRYMKPEIKKAECIGCGQCMPYCPEAVIDFDSEKKADIDFDFCKGCGVCATVCPKNAITMGKN